MVVPFTLPFSLSVRVCMHEARTTAFVYYNQMALRLDDWNWRRFGFISGLEGGEAYEKGKGLNLDELRDNWGKLQRPFQGKWGVNKSHLLKINIFSIVEKWKNS